MGEKIRSFIAIDLPESVLQAITKVQENFRKSNLNIRYVRKEGIHLTLKFLGDIDRADVEKIHAAMGRATKDFSSFTLRGERVGVFPDLKRPRVVWAGLSGDMEALRSLQRDLEYQLSGLGFPKEKRSFKGHLTIGRVKGRLDRTNLSRTIEALGEFRTESFTVRSIVLFQSDLRPQGAVYSSLAEVSIKNS